jgi:transcription elongation factor Elf1
MASIQCRVCDSEFPSETKLFKHLDVHKNQEKCEKCDKCENITSNKTFIWRYKLFLIDFLDNPEMALDEHIGSIVRCGNCGKPTKSSITTLTRSLITYSIYNSDQFDFIEPSHNRYTQIQLKIKRLLGN